MAERPQTVRDLRKSGYNVLTVREELRKNLIVKVRAGEPVVQGFFGYDDTVLPALENALLAGQDVIFLGERGQAKSRLIRSLPSLLDEEIPILGDVEIPENPYNPITREGRELVEKYGDKAPLRWLHRDDRYSEKLATPDISIADLIGEVDPIRVAEGRYLADEMTIHFGLVPRSNRGIFCINELPDLAERIQVGLLNLMEERDVQIRGFRVRLPLDIPDRRQRQPRGLHQPRPHHHPPQGPLRRPGAHPLPRGRRHRGPNRAPRAHASQPRWPPHHRA